MGQYYRGVILGKTTKRTKKIIVRKAFCCYEHHNGAKLMEHSYVGNWYVKEYEHALANKFFGFPFVWIGDYAEDKYDTNVFDAAHNYIDSKKVVEATPYDNLPTYKYIINFDKKVFVRIPEKPNNHYDEKGNYILTIHPLPLLCADGNQQGNGDYYGTNETLVGSWAYDRIGVGNELPDNIKTELVVSFEESYLDASKTGDNFKYVWHE